MKQLIITLFVIINLSVIAQDTHELPKKPTVYNLNNKYGLADLDGTTILKPIYDSIFVFTDRYYPWILIKDKEKYGFGIKIHSKGWKFTAIKYDNIKKIDFGFYILKNKNKYGFIGFDYYTRPTTNDLYNYIDTIFNYNFKDAIYDSIYWENNKGYTLLKNKKYGLYISGKTMIPTLYDTLPEFYEGYRGRGVVYAQYKKNKLYFFIKKINKYGFINIEDNKTITKLSPIYERDELKYFSEYEKISYKDEDGYERTKTIKNSYILIVPKINKPIQVFNIRDSTYTFLKDEKGEFIYRGDFSKFFFYASKKDYYIKNKKTNIYDSIVGFYNFKLFNVEGNSIYNKNKKIFFNLNSRKSYVLESKNGIYNTSFDENINGLKHFYFKVNYKSNKEIEVIYYSYFENKKICSLLLKDIYGDDDIYINKISDDYVNLTIGKNENLIGKIKIKTLKFTPAKKWYGCKKKKGEGWELTYPEY